MEMGQVQKTFGYQNGPAGFQERQVPIRLKALIVAVTTVASAAIGFLLASLTGLAIGALVGTGLGFTAIVIANNFMRQPQTDPNLDQKAVSVNDQAKKTVILNPSAELEAQPPEIDTRVSLTHLNISDNPLTALPPAPTALKNQDLTSITDQVLSEGIDEKSQSNSPINNQVVKIRIRDADGNTLEAIPAEIGEPSSLKNLNLFNDRLEGLPPETRDFRSFTSLNFSNDQLQELPAAIGDFRPFTNLDRNSNQPQPPSYPTLAEIEIQGLTDVTDPNSAEGLIKFYKRLPIDGKPQFDDGSTTEQARKIQNWMKENPETLNLESLNLSNLELKKLPKEICLFIHLKELNLLFNELEDLPAEIGKLHSLTNLNLRYNRLQAFPTAIANLPSLTRLNLSLNKLQALPLEIGNLPSLTDLNLSNNQFKILPPEIGNLPSLTQLDLSDNPFEELLLETANLPSSLTHLDFGFGFIRTNRGFDLNQRLVYPPKIGNLNYKGLGTYRAPVELKIQDLTDVTDPNSPEEDLVQFYKLLRIDGKPQFDGSIGEQAEKIQAWMMESPEVLNLESLDLSNSKLTRLPKEIGLFVHLKKLNLFLNELKELPAEIGKLHSLTRLDLSCNQLQALPLEIGNLPSLTDLDLSSNQLQAVPLEISNITSLTNLELRNNELKELPPEIGKLHSLTSLDLSSNQFKAFPPEIYKLLSLTHLDLGNNDLQALPPEINNLTNLTHLDLGLYWKVVCPPKIGNLNHEGLGTYRTPR